MKLNGFIGFLIMLTAWGLLSGHDYIPHHHHEYCVSTHELHHEDEKKDVIDITEDHAHDLSCNFSQVFDKSGKKNIFLSTQKSNSEAALTEIKQLLIPYLRKFVPLLYQLHCPMRAPPVIL